MMHFGKSDGYAIRRCRGEALGRRHTRSNIHLDTSDTVWTPVRGGRFDYGCNSEAYHHIYARAILCYIADDFSRRRIPTQRSANELALWPRCIRTVAGSGFLVLRGSTPCTMNASRIRLRSPSLPMIRAGSRETYTLYADHTGPEEARQQTKHVYGHVIERRLQLDSRAAKPKGQMKHITL
jgi:hypothetical protein